MPSSSSSSSSGEGANHKGYTWSAEDMCMLASVDLIIAADVVYDDVQTDAFLQATIHLIRQARRAGHGRQGMSLKRMST